MLKPVVIQIKMTNSFYMHHCPHLCPHPILGRQTEKLKEKLTVKNTEKMLARLRQGTSRGHSYKNVANAS
jgi:hypothetical protein